MQNSRKQLSRLSSLVLFIALSVAQSPKAQAQVACIGLCEQQLADCLRNSGPVQSPSCGDLYEICVNNCVGLFAARLG